MFAKIALFAFEFVVMILGLAGVLILVGLAAIL